MAAWSIFDGLAYYGESFNDGQPLKFHYLNKQGAIHFHKLVEYTVAFETGLPVTTWGVCQFVHVPMMSAALNLVSICDPGTHPAVGLSNYRPIDQRITKQGLHHRKQRRGGSHIFWVMLPGGKMSMSSYSNWDKTILCIQKGNALRISIQFYTIRQKSNATGALITSCL